MKDICQKYLNKIKRNINTLVFIYGGGKLNFNLKFKNVITDKESKVMKVLVYSNENDEFICPKCGEKIKLNTEKIDQIILSINNLKETIDSARALLENVIEKSPAYNSQLKGINMILNILNEDIKKIKDKVINLLKENKITKIKESYESKNNQNLGALRKENQLYIANKNIKILKQNDFNNKINYLNNSKKEEFSNKIKFIQGEIDKKKFHTEKLYSRSIPDGIYLIYPAHCQGKVLDITGASKDDNAILQLYDFNNTNAQKFEIIYNTSKRFYSIMCLCSDKYITFNQSNLKIVQLAENNNNKNQQWHIISQGNNYEIISEFNGKLMDVFGGGTSCGECITTSERSGELHQQFKFVTTTKTLPPPPPPPVNYFPIPNFHHPFSDRNSIVDALKSIGVDSSLNYRAVIGQKNGIPGIAGEPDFNIRMLNLLKSGRLIIP